MEAVKEQLMLQSPVLPSHLTPTSLRPRPKRARIRQPTKYARLRSEPSTQTRRNNPRICCSPCNCRPNSPTQSVTAGHPRREQAPRAATAGHGRERRTDASSTTRARVPPCLPVLVLLCHLCSVNADSAWLRLATSLQALARNPSRPRARTCGVVYQRLGMRIPPLRMQMPILAGIRSFVLFLARPSHPGCSLLTAAQFLNHSVLTASRILLFASLQPARREPSSAQQGSG